MSVLLVDVKADFKMNRRLENFSVKICYHLTAVLCQDFESIAVCSVKRDAASAEVDAIQRHIQPHHQQETLDLSR